MVLYDRKLEDYQAIGFNYYCSYTGVWLMRWQCSDKYERIYVHTPGKTVIVSGDLDWWHEEGCSCLR